MKTLKSAVTLPFCTPQGCLIDQRGYDAETCLYLHVPVDYSANVPRNPTEEQVRAALTALVAPWRAYRFATNNDAAAMVSAVLTAVARPVLDIAPAILLEAATVGSGKTKAASALGSLMTGRREGAMPANGIDDDELRKSIVAGLLDGSTFTLLDNLMGIIDSTVLAALLTSGRVRDRVLGASKTVDVESRMLVTMTANNATLNQDLARRTCVVRIDGGAAPTARPFEFDPVDVALRERVKIAEAACVIWRAYFNAGAPRIANDDAGGYVAWTKLCRQPVLWLQREGHASALPTSWCPADATAPILGDPAASLLRLAEHVDPEIEPLADFLRAAWALSEGRAFTAREVLAWSSAVVGVGLEVREALAELVPNQRGDLTARTLSKALSYRRDRAAGSLVLRQGGRMACGQLWRVERVAS